MSLNRALEGAPGDSTLRLSLGHNYLEKKDFAGALAAANEVLRTDPDNKNAKSLKYQSTGRVAPSEGGSTTPSPTRQEATVAANTGSQVTFTDQAKHKPISVDVPGAVEDAPSPKDGKPLPLWPLAAPIGAGLIGYGIYRNQRTTWGANEPLDTPAELTDEQIAGSRKKLKFAALAGGVLLGGAAIATFGPAVVTGVEAFFLSAGPIAGGLVPAYASGVGAGAAASTLNPVTVAAGAETLGATVVLVGEAKVASDYYSYSKSRRESGSSTQQPIGQETGASSNLKKPSAKDPQLKNTIDRLFRESDQLRGGTAGAVRSEAQTGLATGRKFHAIKAQENISNLQKILRRTNLDPVDRATAEALLSDLQNALKASVKP